jgi:AraC-like DNA-binding protein
VAAIAADRGLVRVGERARALGVGPRRLQRLFAEYVGAGPKGVIRRFRMHEALARTTSGASVNWGELAVDLGYSDQAHFIRDFTTNVGIPPVAYIRAAVVSAIG